MGISIEIQRFGYYHIAFLPLYWADQDTIRIKCFQLDHGCDYTNDVVRLVFQKAGILSVYTFAGDSSSRDVAEGFTLTFLKWISYFNCC